MNRTRFQLPPRTHPGNRIDPWMTGNPRWLDDKPADASARPSEPSVSMTFPFMFGMTRLLAAHQQNLEAIAAANRIVREGAQEIARRNVALMQKAMAGFSERLQMSGVPECPEDRAIRQTETAITAYEDMMATMRELGETLQYAGVAVMDVLGKRFSDAADEVKTQARCATRTFWETDAKPAPFRQPT